MVNSPNVHRSGLVKHIKAYLCVGILRSHKSAILEKSFNDIENRHRMLNKNGRMYLFMYNGFPC